MTIYKAEFDSFGNLIKSLKNSKEGKDMKISEAFPSASGFLTKEDVAKKDFPKALTVSRVEVKTVGKKEVLKINLFFKEIVQKLRLNKKNAFDISELVGSQETDDWVDEKLCIYIDETVTRGTETVGGMRVKAV